MHTVAHVAQDVKRTNPRTPRQSDGFFEAWTGTLAQLRKVAAEKKAEQR